MTEGSKAPIKEGDGKKWWRTALDPFGSHRSEDVTKEVGGRVLGSVERAGGAGLLTVGFFQEQLRSLNQVSIRIYRDGEAAAAVNLSPDEAYDVAVVCLPAGANARVTDFHHELMAPTVTVER